MKPLLLLCTLTVVLELAAYSQERKPLLKPSYKIIEKVPAASFMESPLTGKKIDLTPQGKFDSQTGNFVILLRNPEDTMKWARVLWEPATKLEVIVTAQVSMEGSEYVYDYTLQNLSSSRQAVGTFALEVDTAVVVSCQVPNEGKWHYYLPNARRKMWVFSGGDIVTSHGEIVGYVLKAGRTLGGFVVRSQSPPAMITCYVTGNVGQGGRRVIGLSAEMVPSEILDALPSASEDRLMGITIGPQAATATITPAQFLDRLLSMIDESFKEGWIGKEALAHQFHTLVNSAKEQLLKGNTVGGKQTLNTFLQLVETTYQRGEILSEPYGLFKYNTLYLTEKLLE